MESAAIGNVLVSADGRTGTITLNEPERLNPIGAAAAEALIAAAHWMETRAEIRVVVVRGEGRAFSAGADVAAFPEEMTPEAAREVADAGRRMADAFEALPAVCVAQIHGHCVGGAVVLAAACDLRIAADETRFAIPEIDLGIPLVWGGIPRLVRELGPARTKDLVMTCRPFTSAEALAAGFLTSVVPDSDLEATVRDLARSLAQKPRYALWSTKRHVNAVARTMVDQPASWADADRFVAAMHDPEGRAAATAYVQAMSERSRTKARDH